MRNLIKKSLAFCLVAALALTCFVGSVSAAETYSATISVANQTITQGTTSVDVVLDIASADAGINEALIKVSSTLGTIASEATVVESDSAAVIEYDQGTTDYGTFYLSAQNVESETGTALGSVKSAKIKLTFTVAADVAVGDYDIVIDIPDDKVIAASANEDIINFTYTTAKVTVEAAVSEPVLDSNLKIMLRSASVQDTLGIGYVIQNATYAAYDKIEIEVIANKYNADRDVVLNDPITIPVNQLNAALSNATYTGIAMFELDLAVSAKIKAYDADGNYVAYSETYTDTPVALLKSTYASSTSELFKTMVTDMFNLGTQAQKYFGEMAATNNADNDLLAAYNSNPINKDWDQTHASASLPNLTLVNDIKWADNAPLTSADLMFLPSVNLAATPTLGYLVMDKANKFTSEDIRLEVSYTAVYPTAFAGEKTQTIEGAGWTSVASYETATFTKMTLTDSNQTITAKLYYNDQLVLTSEYTIDQGINNLVSGNGGALATELGKFEAAARAYFASI